MKYFYSSVDKDPVKDLCGKMSLEALGLLYRMKRQLALEHEPSGILFMNGMGDKANRAADILEIAPRKYLALTKELEECGELVPYHGFWKLIRWQKDQERYFKGLESVAKSKEKAKQRKVRKK